jgi:hypothetical protein
MTSELTPTYHTTLGGPTGPAIDMHGLAAMATIARAQGFYLRAADLYHEAAREAFSVEERLHLTMREAHCRSRSTTARPPTAGRRGGQGAAGECYAELASAASGSRP